jgi:hypothetical protein
VFRKFKLFYLWRSYDILLLVDIDDGKLYIVDNISCVLVADQYVVVVVIVDLDWVVVNKSSGTDFCLLHILINVLLVMIVLESLSLGYSLVVTDNLWFNFFLRKVSSVSVDLLILSRHIFGYFYLLENILSLDDLLVAIVKLHFAIQMWIISVVIEVLFLFTYLCDC